MNIFWILDYSDVADNNFRLIWLKENDIDFYRTGRYEYGYDIMASYAEFEIPCDEDYMIYKLRWC